MLRLQATLRHTIPVLLLAIFCLPHSARASVPSNPADQCQVILRYEALCENWRPYRCEVKPGVDYSNTEQQNTINNYRALCVWTPGNSVDRYSHECIQYLGIGATCASTVPDLVEYQVYRQPVQVMVYRDEPKYQIYQQPARLCSLLSDTAHMIKSYHEACGDVAASACSNAAAPITAFQNYCGTKKPCECVADSGCYADYCHPTTPGDSSGTPGSPASPGTPATPGTPRGPGGDGATSPGDTGTTATGSTPTTAGSSTSPGANNNNPGEGGGSNIVAGASGDSSSAKQNPAGGRLLEGGCSLGSGETQPLSIGFWLGILLPTLGLGALYSRRFFHQR